MGTGGEGGTRFIKEKRKRETYIDEGKCQTGREHLSVGIFGVEISLKSEVLGFLRRRYSGLSLD